MREKTKGIIMSTTQINPETFTWQGENQTCPFFADEDANITGYGHQDKKALAEAISRHGPEDPADAVDHTKDIQHIYVRDDAENELFIVCGANEDGTYPVTTYWVAR